MPNNYADDVRERYEPPAAAELTLQPADAWAQLTAAQADIRQIAKLVANLSEYCDHLSACVRSQWEAGEPTPDGGYRMKYAGIWYNAKPIDETPKCDCGLDEVLSKCESAVGLDSGIHNAD